MSQNQQLLSKVERDIADLIIDKLEHEEITLERASLIAQFVLAHLPENLTDEQVIHILPSLDDEFIELASVVHKYMSAYEMEHSTILASQMTDLIKHDHFEEASTKAGEYFKQKFM